MNGQTQAGPENLTARIARLVQERGWNQEDFARFTGLNRQTIRQILQEDPSRRLRNDTVGRCARALCLSVSDLRTLPFDRLLLRISLPASKDGANQLQHLYDRATQPELQAWLDRNPERAQQLASEEIDELLSLQGTGGPLTSMGVEHYVEIIERKRQLIQQVHAIAGTEYLEVLEKLVALMYEKVQPYRNRA
jgi:transcriptional regulator with XRE-family HTH domain